VNVYPGGIYHYDSEAQANADIEQARAEALEVLRTARSYSISALTAAGKTFHSTIAGEADALAFLAYTAAKSHRNLVRIIGAEKAQELTDAILVRLEELGE
jgi:hypothetical protein